MYLYRSQLLYLQRELRKSGKSGKWIMRNAVKTRKLAYTRFVNKPK